MTIVEARNKIGEIDRLLNDEYVVLSNIFRAACEEAINKCLKKEKIEFIIDPLLYKMRYKNKQKKSEKARYAASDFIREIERHQHLFK